MEQRKKMKDNTSNFEIIDSKIGHLQKLIKLKDGVILQIQKNISQLEVTLKKK